MTPPPALVAERTVWLGDRLVELTIANPLLDPPCARTTVRVLLPTGHDRSGRRYPVVLLLHGAGDTARSWTTNLDGWPVTLEAFTSDKDVVVVMPDGGQGATAGWYSDWFNGGALGPPAWETYHLEQLRVLVDRTFSTRTDRGGRVVAGLSMGGFGAMSYAARHPDPFAGAFSFSGALDTARLAGVLDSRIWGDRRHDARRRAHNPADLAENLADTTVWFRTGAGGAGGPAPRDAGTLDLEAYLWPTNESFATALRTAGVRHHYEAYPAGGHNWYHWHDGFQQAWPEMQALFDRPPSGRLGAFGFRSFERRFHIWGWDVTVDGPVVEGLRLAVASPTRLSLQGIGTVKLDTPPEHEPGRRYRVATTRTSGGVEPAQAQADADGRLHLTVALGAGGVGGVAEVEIVLA